jgi:hypothetical protein
VYKFRLAADVQSGYRTCTLYSDFNLPANVTVEYDLANPANNNINAQLLTLHNHNPHNGQLVPQCFKDINVNTIPDDDAVSGPVFQLADGTAQC